MQIVVDTNILVSFFRQNPVNMLILSPLNFEFYAPEHAVEELRKNEKNLLKYSRLSLNQLEGKFSELSNFIKIIKKKEFEEFERKARQLSPHEKDIPIFALALKLKCPIWSNEPGFKAQNKVNVFSTREIIELL